MGYYENRSHLSCSYLKKVWRQHHGGKEPGSFPESLAFGQMVDDLNTGEEGEQTTEEAKKLDKLYRRETKTPYHGDKTKRFQHEFYRTLRFNTSAVKFRGKTDIWYPKHKIVEDIKTTKTKTKTRNSIDNMINHFGYDMQIVAYMILSGSDFGVLSFLSRSGWFHQEWVFKMDAKYLSGYDKLCQHIELWQTIQESKNSGKQ